ncbi:MAG TPA: TonB family protein [Cyclobacteriaceae bacterium]|nr:TonB family protein [Cyclobacteriaceae bacterium]
MELKKNPEVDVHRKSTLFLNIGLVVSLLAVITAFEWKFYDDGKRMDLGKLDENFEEMLEIPPTEQPPPPPPKIQQVEIIEVEDDKEIEEDLKIDLDIEVTEETKVVPVVVDAPVEEEDVEEIFTIVEQQPTPSGGMAAFYEYVSKKIKYPSQARRMNIEGRVFVEFVVDKDGSLTEVKSIKGIGAGCDEEAVRVIQNAPKWAPGKQRGRPVKVRMVLPIIFKLG